MSTIIGAQVKLMECKTCYSKKFQTTCTKAFVDHFLMFHKITSKSLMTCGFKDCFSKFKYTNRYNQHIAEFHAQDEANKESENDTNIACTEKSFGGAESLKCPYPNCAFTASSKASLRGHKFWKHCEQTESNVHKSKDEEPILSAVNEECDTLMQIETDENQISESEKEAGNSASTTLLEKMNTFNEKEQRDSLLKMFVKMFMTLNSKFHVPESTLQFIVESYRFFVQESLSLSRSSILQRLNELSNVPCEVAEAVLAEFSENTLTVFHSEEGPMRSSYMRQQQYNHLFRYVKPKSYYLGLDQNNKPRKYHFVSIKETLQNMFEDDSLYEQYLEKQESNFQNSDVLTDIHSGTAFQNHTLFKEHPDAIQLILHQDDAEMVNPLGSAKGTYKMTFYNYIIANIHPWNRSNTDNQQLALVCAEKDVAYFGLERVLKPLIDELKELETDGVRIRGKTVKASVLLLLGDNLGTHTVAGFVENFSSSHYFCRYCEESRQEWLARWYSTPKLSQCNDSSNESDDSWDESDPEDDSQSDTQDDSDGDSIDLDVEFGQAEEDEDDIPLSVVRETLSHTPVRHNAPLRTRASYEACVAALERNPSGVKGVVADSQFNQLKNFHVIGGTPPCLPHDIFLGFLPYDLVLALKKLSVLFKFKFESVSRRVKKFEFLDGDSFDKPPSKFSPQMKKLSGHAVQNWTFLRFLPLLIGDKISDKSNPVWKMVLLLIELMQLLCSPIVSKSSIPHIQDLILQYLQLRSTLFDVLLRPKHHYFEHYSWLILLFGPLLRSSTLGFERKNKFYRETIRSKKNLKNCTKLLATEHQRMQSAIKGDCLYNRGTGIQNAIPLEALTIPDCILTCIFDRFGREVASKLAYSKEANFHSTLYKSGRVVVVSTERYPELDLCKIEIFVSYGKNIFAVGKKCNGVLDPNMQIFYLHEMSQTILIALADILDYASYPVYSYDKRPIIVLKHLFLKK